MVQYALVISMILESNTWFHFIVNKDQACAVVHIEYLIGSIYDVFTLCTQNIICALK